MLNTQPAPVSSVANTLSDPEIENIHVTILKKSNAPLRMFFCMICRTGLFGYKGHLTTIDPGNPDAEGEEVTSFPFYARCPSKSDRYGRCPANYIIEGYVERSS